MYLTLRDRDADKIIEYLKKKEDKIVTLNKYLLNNIAYPLKSDVAMENANCVYDTTIDTKDSVAIINCVLQIIEESDLGPQK